MGASSVMSWKVTAIYSSLWNIETSKRLHKNQRAVGLSVRLWSCQGCDATLRSFWQTRVCTLCTNGTGTFNAPLLQSGESLRYWGWQGNKLHWWRWWPHRQLGPVRGPDVEQADQARVLWGICLSKHIHLYVIVCSGIMKQISSYFTWNSEIHTGRYGYLHT